VNELTWLSFDELTNGQAVMHYSRHRLMEFMPMHQPVINELTLLAHWSVCHKLNC